MNDSARTPPPENLPENPLKNRRNPSKPSARPRGAGRWLQALLLVSCGSALAWAWSALPPSLVRGPYLQSASESGITVVFRTSTAATSTLRYGTQAGPPWDHELTGASATTHVFELTGLRPGTRYAYEIASGGALLAEGPDCSFRTAPPDNSRAPLRFVAWGDSGNGSSAQLAVAARMEEVVPPPALALGLGDLVYENGEWENYDPHLFEPYTGLFRRTTFWPTMGNHDYKTENGAPYKDAFHLPTQSGAPGHPSGTELYYSFDHGMVHFSCLDSESSDSNPGSAMYTWLADDLDDARARGKRWLIAFMHHPPYSKGTHDSDDESELVTLRQNLVPLLESKGVDLVLVGHSHVYERSFLAKNGGILQNHPSDYTKIGSPDGTLYLVSGCGGESGDGSLDHPLMAVSRGNVTGFNLFDATYSELRGSFVERDGRTTDLFAVHKAADVAPPRVAHVEPRSATAIELVFDEPVQGGASGGGAENLAHYGLSTGAVLDASLATDMRTVTLTTTALPIGRLRQIQVQGVADSAGNVDVAGEVLALLLEAPGAAQGGTPVVLQGASWRYAKGSSAPPAAWLTPAFDDSGWSQGPAGFGYGDGDDATVLGDMRNNYGSVYLRARFTLADLPTITRLALNVSYDDGFVAFLNGVEVARANVPSGQTSATFASGGHEVDGFEAFDLGAFLGALVSGSNVLAIEGHNSGLDSADFSLHPELVIQRSAGGGGSAAAPVAVLDCEVQEANVPALVSFSARRSLDPAGQGLGYAWGFGDGMAGFGPLVQHRYDRAGTYTVTLFLRSARGQHAIEQRTIRVHALGTAPVARLTASSTQISAGGRVDFDSAGSLDPDGGPLYVHWDFGESVRGAMNESTQARPAHVYAAPGRYAVTLAVTDDEGSTVTQFVVITVQ
jgi:PKD repeat protein